MSQVIKNIAYSSFFIALCLMLGKLLNTFIGGLPASLYGMLFINVMLYFKLINAERIKQTIAWAIENMGVCFVPAGVGIIDHFDLLASYGLEIVGIIFFTTFILITFIGLAIEKSSAKQSTKQSEQVGVENG